MPLRGINKDVDGRSAVYGNPFAGLAHRDRSTLRHAIVVLSSLSLLVCEQIHDHRAQSGPGVSECVYIPLINTPLQPPQRIRHIVDKYGTKRRKPLDMPTDHEAYAVDRRSDFHAETV